MHNNLTLENGFHIIFDNFYLKNWLCDRPRGTAGLASLRLLAQGGLPLRIDHKTILGKTIGCFSNCDSLRHARLDAGWPAFEFIG